MYSCFETHKLVTVVVAIVLSIVWAYLTAWRGISKHPAGNLILWIVGEVLIVGVSALILFCS